MADDILIFDFDGTIADTHHYIVRISNILAPEYGYKTIADNEIEQLRDKSAREMISHLSVPVLKIPAILAHAKRIFHDGIDEIKLIAGMHDVLHDLHRLGYTMGIVSSNMEKNIIRFLQNHDIHIFDFIHSTTKIWSKHHSISKLIRAKKFDRTAVTYIGDETRDITAARKCGIRSLAVTWGYNSEKALSCVNPDILVHTPAELTVAVKI